MSPPKHHGKNFGKGFDFYLSYNDKELALRIAQEALDSPRKANHLAKRLGVSPAGIMALSERLYRWIWED